MLRKKALHSHVSILCITTVIALIYYSIGIDSWKFASVGDDLPFYTFAKSIIEVNFIVNPFSFHGVYDQNSLLSSMYQALFMKLFGATNFAWRFSNIILIIPITIFFYQWLKKNFSPDIALLSTIILQCSFYLANFFKIGKNMPQALALFIICLWAASRSADDPSKKNFFLLGLFFGLAFYIYIGPIFPLIMWPCLLPLLWKNKRKQILINSLFLVLGYLLMLLPAILQFTALTGPAEKTFLYREYTGIMPTIFNIIRNFFLFYHNYDYIYNHFVAGPYLDLLSRFLAFIGSLMTLYYVTRKNYLILILTYIMTCIIIGIISPYSYTPTTRGIFFIPFGAIFAGIALAYLYKRIRTIGVVTILCLTFILNLYQSQIGVFQQAGYSTTALITKTLQEEKAHKHNSPHILLTSQKNIYNAKLVTIVQHVYQLTDIPVVPIKAHKLQCIHLNHTKVIVLADDIEAVSTLYQQNCEQYDPASVRIITPSKALSVL